MDRLLVVSGKLGLAGWFGRLSVAFSQFWTHSDNGHD